MRESTHCERATDELRDGYERASTLILEKSLGEAEDILRWIVDREPGFAPAYNKLGVIEVNRGERDEALEWFRASVQADEDYAPALTNLGNLALERGDEHQAKSYYNRAIEADREYGPAHNSLGILLRQEGRLAESVRHLRIARKHGAYRVTADSLASPRGRRGCLILVGFIVAMVVGAILMFAGL
ncbi:MAG: tetratricopeptide repeat protein [Spirochaetota bacterium]